MSIPWVAMERWSAIASDPDATRRVVIPILLESTDLGPMLGRLAYVDLRGPDSLRRRQAYHGLLMSLLEEKVHELPDPPQFQPIVLVPPEFHCGAIVPFDYFVGRREELNRAESLIDSGQSFLLVGNHHDGKTSFCQRVIERVFVGYSHVLPIYVNVQAWPDVTFETFLEHTILGMIGDIGRQVFNRDYFAIPILSQDEPELASDQALKEFVKLSRHVWGRTHSRRGASPPPFGLEEFVAFHTTLMDIIREKGWRRCVVFYDEANRLPRESSAQLLANQEELVRVSDRATAGRTSVHAASPSVAEHFVDMKRYFPQQILLGPFRDIDEMRELLARYCFRDPARVADLPAAEAALQTIWDLSCGRPYLIQLLSSRSFRLATQKGATELTRSHVEEAHKELRVAQAFEIEGK